MASVCFLMYPIIFACQQISLPKKEKPYLNSTEIQPSYPIPRKRIGTIYCFLQRLKKEAPVTHGPCGRTCLHKTSEPLPPEKFLKRSQKCYFNICFSFCWVIFPLPMSSRALGFCERLCLLPPPPKEVYFK